MGILNGIRHQLIDIIEWLDDSRDTMVWRFPRYENEIKNGAKLIVRESQAAVFINEGQLADVFTPGTYTLTTQNLPILSTLKGWKYGFNSPFKAEVYFLSMRIFTDRKWGTKNPVMMRDTDFGMVRLRAFGNYSIKVNDPGTFIRQIAGTESRFTLEELDDQLRDLVTSRFADALGASKIPALDLAGNYDQLGQYVTTRIQPDFETFGTQLVKLVVENISLPPEVEAAMDKRTSMGVIGNLNAYTQFQTANAITEAASNPGGAGLAGAGASLAMGVGMANAVGQGMQQGLGAAAAAGGPPPLPKSQAFYVEINGAQAGPFENADLSEKIAAGHLTRNSLVWKQGMAQWTPAGTVAELANLFNSAPPPLPKNG
jgi:membrane protease subunit (stomatin/prohibitin family)